MKPLREESGQVLIIVALGMLAMLGFVGFAADVGVLLHTKREVQTAADDAAIAGAMELSYTDLSTVAQSAAAQDGYTNGSNGATVTINNGPVYGPDAGNTSYVEAIVQQKQPTVFMGLFNHGSMTVAARAVAYAGTTKGCIFTLGTSGTDINLSTSASLDSTGCPVFIDSTSSSALSVTTSASIDAKSIGIVGNYVTNTSGSVNPTPQTGIAPVNDPEASLPAPMVPKSCTTSISATTSHTSSGTPGCYQSITVSTSGTVNLASGTYIVDGGQVSVSTSGTLNGSNVTFYLTNGASLNLSTSAVVNLSAPTSGTYNGVLFFQDRSDSAPGSISTSTSGSMTGIMYFPDASLNLSTSGGLKMTADFVVQSMTVSTSFSFTDYALLSATSATSAVSLVE